MRLIKKGKANYAEVQGINECKAIKMVDFVEIGIVWRIIVW